MYRVLSWSNAYSGEWLVVRVMDRRIMTSGTVWECTRWVKVWGPMHVEPGIKGKQLSPKLDWPECVIICP